MHPATDSLQRTRLTVSFQAEKRCVHAQKQLAYAIANVQISVLSGYISVGSFARSLHVGAVFIGEANPRRECYPNFSLPLFDSGSSAHPPYRMSACSPN